MYKTITYLIQGAPGSPGDDKSEDLGGDFCNLLNKIYIPLKKNKKKIGISNLIIGITCITRLFTII